MLQKLTYLEDFISLVPLKSPPFQWGIFQMIYDMDLCIPNDFSIP